MQHLVWLLFLTSHVQNEVRENVFERVGVRERERERETVREGTEGGAGGEEGAAIAATAVASFIDLPLLVGQRLENCEAKIFAKPPTKKNFGR